MTNTLAKVNMDNFKEVVGGQLEKGKAYMVQSLSGQFKTGLCVNYMMSSTEKSALFTSDPFSFEDTEKLILGREVSPEDRNYEVFGIGQSIEEWKVAEVLKTGVELLVIDFVPGYNPDKNIMKQHVELILMGKSLAKLFNVTILFTRVLNKSIMDDIESFGMKLPDYDSIGFEILTVGKFHEDGEEGVKVKRGDNEVKLKFVSPYKLF